MKPQKRVRGGKVRWVARYVGSDGVERSKTFDFERDAKKWAAEREREVARGEWIDPQAGLITLGEYWQRYVDSARSAGTARVRRTVGKNLGRLDRTPINSIKPPDIRDWMHALEHGRSWVRGCEGVAKTTASTWLGQLSGCLSMAVQDELIQKSPTTNAIKGKRRTVHSVTHDELLTSSQILDMSRAANEGVKAGQASVPAHPTLGRMIIVGACTGLRAGEIAGLRIASVNFLRREAYITEQGSAVNSEFEWGPLKTPSSERVLPLPDAAIEALAAELADRPCSDRSMPIFRTSRDTMWTASTIAYAIRALRVRLGLEEWVTWHSFRHFYASTLIYSNASVKTVQARLGHSNAQMTLDVYSHLWPGEDERTRASLDNALGRDRSGTDHGESTHGSSLSAGQR